MSATDLSSLFDFVVCKRTELAGKLQDRVVAFYQNPDPPPQSESTGNPTSRESSPMEVWQHYGFVSRPPADAELFRTTVGSNTLITASRSSAAKNVYGKLSEGDCALFTDAGNMLKLGRDGTASLLIPTDSGKDMILHFSPKDGGSVKFVIPSGPSIELSAKNGVYINAGLKTMTLAAAEAIQCIGSKFVNACGVFMTHIAAKLPLVGVAALTPGAPNVFI
ncbi:MAG: hypothetical protein WC563_15750 [Brevundimonas sp.]